MKVTYKNIITRRFEIRALYQNGMLLSAKGRSRKRRQRNLKTSSLEDFKKWVKDGKGNRLVNIVIGEHGQADHASIWAFNYVLMSGQFVNSVEDINFEDENADKEKAEYLRLKAKYENEGITNG